MGKLIDITLLYVEDEDTVRESVERSLKLMIKNVITAANGEIALENFNSKHIDLIVTDIRMPKLDGLSMVSVLREKGLDIPVIVTSAYNDVEFLSKAIDLHVDKFVNKPVRITALMQAIVKVSETVLAKKMIEQKISELRRYREVIEQTNFIVYADVESKVLKINKEFCDYLINFGADCEKIYSLDELFSQEVVNSIYEKVLNYEVISSQITLRVGVNQFSVLLTAFASGIEDEKITEITILLKDMTTILQEKDALINSLYTDDLTKLPNRQKLFYDLNNEENMKIIIVDIDGFSKINYLYGFESGDEILRQVANLLRETLSHCSDYRLYRSDKDHFVMTVPKIHKDTELNAIETIERAHSIIKVIEEQTYFMTDGAEISLNVTVGGSSNGTNDIYTEASLALEIAKQKKINFISFNDIKDMKNIVHHNLRMQSSIKDALQNGNIINYYQPIMNSEGELVKYEALVRMRDIETNTILTPYHFLNIAKESKNYPLLTKTVITNAFKDFENSNISFSINISFSDIINPEVVIFLSEMIARYKGPPVTIELLESEGMHDIEKTIEFCKNMRLHGALIAIDDFGSGYSNFSHIFQIPIDILKIDGSLVKGVHDYNGYLLLEAIVELSKKYGLKTVAEFVEDEKSFERLKTLGIDMYQGYHFSKPKPLNEF